MARSQGPDFPFDSVPLGKRGHTFWQLLSEPLCHLFARWHPLLWPTAHRAARLRAQALESMDPYEPFAL